MDFLSPSKILIIDGDDDDAQLLDGLTQQGCLCRAVKTLAEGMACLAESPFDAVISELSLPDGSVFSLFGETSLPVLVYTADGRDEEIVAALSAGAADYVLKPCSPSVMAARLKRRMPPRGVLFCRGITLRQDLRTVSYGEKPIKLTSSEFNILRFLMSHPGEFFTADEIYERVWNASSMQTSVVRFHISNLKKALFSATGEQLIVTEFGIGYAFAAAVNRPDGPAARTDGR